MDNFEKADVTVTVMLKHIYEHISDSCGFTFFSNVPAEFCCILANFT